MCNNGNMPDQPSQLPDTSSPLSSGKRVAMPPVATEPAVPSKAEVDTVAEVGSAVPMQQARDDAHLVRLWLHGKSRNTRDAYERDLRAFVGFADRPLPSITLQHLQDWADHLKADGLAASTRARKLSAVKSLFTFGHRLGYLIYNVGAAVSPPKTKDRLAERILPEAAVHRVLAVADAAAESGPFTARRDALLLRLFYASGGRVSELAALRWRDVAARSVERGRPTGQVTLFGKGEKTRRVLLSADTWASLTEHRESESASGFGEADVPVFRSSRVGHGPQPLSRQQLWRIVKGLAKRAGLPEAVSPHWMRHAHASHALDRGAPPHLVQETLGHASLQTTSRYTHARPDDSSARYLGV